MGRFKKHWIKPVKVGRKKPRKIVTLRHIPTISSIAKHKKVEKYRRRKTIIEHLHKKKSIHQLMRAGLRFASKFANAWGEPKTPGAKVRAAAKIQRTRTKFKLGPPKTIDPNLFTLELNSKGKRMFDNWRVNDQNKYRIMMLFYIIWFNKIREALYKSGERWINRYCPKDTGALRKSLIRCLLKSRTIHPSKTAMAPSQLKLKIEFKPDIALTSGGTPYWVYVNRMPEEWLRHSPARKYHRQTSFRTGKALFDPKAQHGFIQLLTMIIRNDAKKYIRIMIEYISRMMTIGGYPMNKRDIGSMLKTDKLGRKFY